MTTHDRTSGSIHSSRGLEPQKQHDLQGPGSLGDEMTMHEMQHRFLDGACLPQKRTRSLLVRGAKSAETRGRKPPKMDESSRTVQAGPTCGEKQGTHEKPACALELKLNILGPTMLFSAVSPSKPWSKLLEGVLLQPRQG